MTNRQNIEIQYLKLLSVTLMLTAACVSDADEHNGHLQTMLDVREIILDQIQQIAVVPVEEGIDWEKALELADSQYQPSFLFQPGAKGVYYIELLSVSQKLLDDNIVINKSVTAGRVISNPKNQKVNTDNIHSCELFCVTSFPTRAGPLA